jgi:hypothetical protein
MTAETRIFLTYLRVSSKGTELNRLKLLLASARDARAAQTSRNYKRFLRPSPMRRISLT